MAEKAWHNKRKDSNRIVLRKGEGQRPNGTYDYRWTDGKGKRRVIYGKTLKELREKEDQLKRDKLDHIRPDARTTTVNDMYELWSHIKRGIKDHTFQNYKYMYELHVKPDFGNRILADLKKSDVKRFYNMLVDQRHLRVSTVDNIHTVLHQVLDLAVEDNLIRMNPSNSVLRELKQSHGFLITKRSALTRDEEALFLNYLRKNHQYHHWYPIFALMDGTGLRVGEATGLRWCDVDFDTFSKSDFRAVKVLECTEVPKSKKLLQFKLDDGSGTERVILSGIKEYYDPEELVGRTCIAITNLPPRKMMGIESCGMLISAVHEEEGEEKLHLLMVDPHIPAGAKLY